MTGTENEILLCAGGCCVGHNQFSSVS